MMQYFQAHNSLFAVVHRCAWKKGNILCLCAAGKLLLLFRFICNAWFRLTGGAIVLPRVDGGALLSSVGLGERFGKSFA